MAAAVQLRHVASDQRVMPHRPITPTPPTDPISAFRDAMQLALAGLEAAAAPTSSATVAELVGTWLTTNGPTFTPSTLSHYRSDTGAVLRLVGPDRRLSDLKAADFEVAIDQLPHGRWNAVSRCWRAGLRWGHGHGFPGAVALLPALRAHKAIRHSYAEDVWRRAVLALAIAYRDAKRRSIPAAGATLGAVLWGVRRGAVARMRYDELDERRGLWRVDDKGHQRIVPLGPIGWALVAAQRRRGPWVWPAARRGAVTPHVSVEAVTSHARRAFDAAGLVELTLHQAGRHAAACAALARGASLADVAGFLGHRDLQTVATVYAVPSGGDRTRAELHGSLVERSTGRSLVALGPGVDHVQVMDECDRDVWERELARRVGA
jgi:Phage integrase family